MIVDVMMAQSKSIEGRAAIFLSHVLTIAQRNVDLLCSEADLVGNEKKYPRYISFTIDQAETDDKEPEQ